MNCVTLYLISLCEVTFEDFGDFKVAFGYFKVEYQSRLLTTWETFRSRFSTTKLTSKTPETSKLTSYTSSNHIIYSMSCINFQMADQIMEPKLSYSSFSKLIFFSFFVFCHLHTIFVRVYADS